MPAKYTFFTPLELKPMGWLRRQLRLQADGLCGNLDRVWPDVRDSAWFGGEREGWERAPYWLDGFVPMAYLLEDEELIARANRCIDQILERQQPDGWICPVPPEQRRGYDLWAVLLIGKVLTHCYSCTRDERIPGALYRMMKNLHGQLRDGTVSLTRWGAYRWYEGFVALRLLRERGAEAWMDDLARLLAGGGMDYRRVETLWERPLNKWTFDTHIVNLCEMLRCEPLTCDMLGQEDRGLAEHFYRRLREFNGTAVGTFTGDECLSGISPTQGTELCAVVELMDSMEQLYAYTGNRVWAERLERVAFNALPAALTEDMWAHQYVQMVNQIDCTPFPGKSYFRTNNSEAHRYGLEPHFGCCTANFGQGWPKLALSAFLRAPDGVLGALPLPSRLCTEWKGTPVRITLTTDYPFRNHMHYRVEADGDTDMRLHVRIPSFARNLRVNGWDHGRRGELVRNGFRQGVTELEIDFDVDTVLETRPHGLRCLRRGSLVFSLPVEAECTRVEYVKHGVERKYPYCDYDYRGISDWNLAFAGWEFRVEECGVSDIPFSQSHPPLRIHANLCHINWGLADGYETVCAPVPLSRRPLDAPTDRLLIPYGCARLRMTELPLV